MTQAHTVFRDWPRFIVSLALGCSLLSVVGLHAQVGFLDSYRQPSSIAEVVDTCPHIVHGTVTRVSAPWLEDGRFVVRTVRFALSEVPKGTDGLRGATHVEFRMWGGTVVASGRTHALAFPYDPFEVNDEAILCLASSTREKGRYFVRFAELGIFRIDTASGSIHVPSKAYQNSSFGGRDRTSRSELLSLIRQRVTQR